MKHLITITALSLATACTVPAHDRVDRTVYVSNDGQQFSQTPQDGYSDRITCDRNIFNEIVWLDKALTWPDHYTQEQATRACRIDAAMRE